MGKRSLWRYLQYGCIGAVCIVIPILIWNMNQPELAKTIEPTVPIVPATTPTNEVGIVETAVGGSGSLLQPGDEITIRTRTAYFSEQLSAINSIEDWKIQYYSKEGESLPVESVGDEMLSVQTYERGTLWIPIWYTTEASSQVEWTDPGYVTVRTEANLSLAPESTLKWALEGREDELVCIARWNDWYGVIVAPSFWHKEYDIYRPVMLWVHEQDILDKRLIEKGLFDPDSTMATDVIRNLTEIKLAEGASQASVRKWLGEPHYIETSENLEQTGEPIRLGVTWRYERSDAQFTVSFSAEDRLERMNWILPTEGKSWGNLSSGDDYYFTYDFPTTPLSATIDWTPVWHNQGDLNFTYLIGANEEVLLIKGDDGGFSGMHNDSSIYAVNRQTGKKLWQLDAGFGWLTAKLDHTGENVTLFSDYDPSIKEYVNRIQHIRLSDGKVLWEYKPSLGDAGIDISATRDSILVYDRQGPEDTTRKLVVLDSETGKVKWEKTLSVDYQMLNEGPQDQYVLIQDDNQLEALDSDTGSTVWEREVVDQQVTVTNPEKDPYYAGGERIDPFVPRSSTRWVFLGDQWLLMNMNSGEQLAAYAAKAGERFEVIDERYLLVQRSDDHEESNGDGVETVFYDTKNSKVLWTMKGLASKGVIEGKRMYLVVNGVPTSVDKLSGKIVWQMDTTSGVGDYLTQLTVSSYAVMDQYLLLPYGKDLLLLGKKDGKVIGRIQNIRVGYAELREQDTRNGTINIVGNEIYVGSANGGFARFNTETLAETLVEIDNRLKKK
ncbi:outer membrane protein assembly factor BamB [Paenibacillus sp. DS2015]|uniref:outer membrane protein assembly factor BamB family protein n=1 Tax=Paenibacillus sp. DS2015 TaxID=3373917 RepID=UPI003D1A9F31